MFILALVGMNVKADNASILVRGTVTPGTESVLSIVLKNDVPVKIVDYGFIMPEGIRTKDIISKTSLAAATNFFVADHYAKIVLSSAQGDLIPASDEYVEIAQFICDVDPDMELGEHDVISNNRVTGVITRAGNVALEVVNNEVSQITVQRAYAVTSMGTDYGFEVVPFTMGKGVSYDYESDIEDNFNVALLMKNAQNAGYVSFDVEFPEGINWAYNADDEDFQAINGTLTNTSRAFGGSGYSFEQDEDNERLFHVRLGRLTGSNYYFNASSELTEIAYLPLESVSTLSDGVYTIKFTNIMLQERASGTVHEGDYFVSVFVGLPTESDPIVYGNYESTEAQSALETVRGARTVDMTQTTGMTSESAAALLEGTYVQGATQSALMPKSAGTYRTVCVPVAVSGTEGERYVISAVSESSITLAPAPETIDANTPFVATAGVVVGDESVYPNPDVAPETAVGILKFKGLYKKSTINAGSYYIAQDKFWKATSDVTVAPFKAVLNGTLAAKSLKIFIEDETGIREVTNQFDNEDIYNLQGIKLNKTQKGINIVGGKKVILK